MKQKTSHEKNGRRRPISEKRMNKLELELKSASESTNSLIDKVASLEKIVSSKEVVLQPEKKGGEAVTKKLLPAEVSGYKLLFEEAKLALKKAKRVLKKAGTDYSKACKHNGACVVERSKKFNAELDGEHKAKREKDVRTDKVIGIITALKENDDPRFTSLTNAVANGNLFRKEMNKILEKEDPETYTTISGLSAVKSDIYRTVKGEFFGKPDDGSDDDNDDDNAAALVTA